MTAGCSWPEQDAVDAWLKKHEIVVSRRAATELKDEVSKLRIEIQVKLQSIKNITDTL